MTRDFFEYKGNNPKIINVKNKLNEIFNGDEIYTRISSKKDGYYLSNTSGSSIANYIKHFPYTIEIELYKSKNPFTSSNGYYIPSKPYTVHLNTRKLGRTNASIAATAAHELIHAVDGFIDTAEFGHGDNTHTPEKEDCAPFYIDNLVESMISGVKMEDLDIRTKLSNVNIKYVPVWYKRIFMPWKWFI